MKDDGNPTSPGKRGSRRAYSGRVISLDIDTVQLPNGTVGELEIVRHPGASAVVPFLSDPHGDDPVLLLLRQYRYAADGYVLEVPAGRLEAGEDPASCAIRELREETGCTATQVDRMTTILTTPGFTDERIHLFIATGLTRGASATEHDEFIQVETVTLSACLDMIKKGEIVDAKTALAILFAAGFRTGR